MYPRVSKCFRQINAFVWIIVFANKLSIQLLNKQCQFKRDICSINALQNRLLRIHCFVLFVFDMRIKTQLKQQ